MKKLFIISVLLLTIGCKKEDPVVKEKDCLCGSVETKYSTHAIVKNYCTGNKKTVSIQSSYYDASSWEYCQAQEW